MDLSYQSRLSVTSSLTLTLYPALVHSKHRLCPWWKLLRKAAMGRWNFSTEQFGVLSLQTHEKTGKGKGVSKSGTKKQARIWCPRRRRTLCLGSFNSSPEAQVAVAQARTLGPENLPTPAPGRKPRTIKAGTPCAPAPAPPRPSLTAPPRWCAMRQPGAH